MPVTVRAKAPDLRGLSRDLKRAGRTDLRKELQSGLRRATRPVRAEVKRAWAAELPQSGGLAALAARSSVRTQLRGAGVRIIAGGTRRGVRDIARIERGVARHPVYGNRSVWAQNAVRPRIFADAVRESADEHVVGELLDALENVANKLT